MPTTDLLPDKTCKAFLFKMMVIRKDLRNAAIPHHIYRDAIDKAVAFVESLLVQIHTMVERFRGRWRSSTEYQQRYGSPLWRTLDVMIELVGTVVWDTLGIRATDLCSDLRQRFSNRS